MSWLLLTDIQQSRLLRCGVTQHRRCHVEECETLQNNRIKHQQEEASPLRKSASVTYGIDEDRSKAADLKYFVRQLNHWLPGVMRQHAIENVVVVAPSRLLGELRAILAPELKPHCEQRKGEWIHLSVRELAEHPLVLEQVGLES